MQNIFSKVHNVSEDNCEIFEVEISAWEKTTKQRSFFWSLLRYRNIFFSPKTISLDKSILEELFKWTEAKDKIRH